MDSAEDEPVGQRMRVVSVMDISPGRAAIPEVGRPIGVLTLGHRDEVEQPLMISIDDVRRLAIGCMRVLAHHGDGGAEQALLKYSPDALFEDDSGKRPSKDTFPAGRPRNLPAGRRSEGATAGRQSQGVPAGRPVLVAQFRMRRANPVSFTILAGYRLKAQWMLLAHSSDFNVRLLVKVGRRMAITLNGHLDDEAIPQTEWEMLQTAKAGSSVRIGKRRCAVMSEAAIRSLVDRKTFWVTNPK